MRALQWFDFMMQIVNYLMLGFGEPIMHNLSNITITLEAATAFFVSTAVV